jgi:hypothetical protein
MPIPSLDGPYQQADAAQQEQCAQDDVGAHRPDGPDEFSRFRWTTGGEIHVEIDKHAE